MSKSKIEFTNWNKEQFLHDVEKHTMKIIMDIKEHRHIRFRRPGTIIYGFDLITWPGHLCITGDCGTYVFRRLLDMFEFFRTGDETLYINPGYWSEKVLAMDQHQKIDKFSAEVFRSSIKESFDSYYEDRSEVSRAVIWKEVEDQVLVNDDNEYTAFSAAMEFTHDKHAPFQDFWEINCREYDYGYLWCLCAIVWGIQQYDKQRAEVPA